VVSFDSTKDGRVSFDFNSEIAVLKRRHFLNLFFGLQEFEIRAIAPTDVQH